LQINLKDCLAAIFACAALLGWWRLAANRHNEQNELIADFKRVGDRRVSIITAQGEPGWLYDIGGPKLAAVFDKVSTVQISRFSKDDIEEEPTDRDMPLWLTGLGKLASIDHVEIAGAIILRMPASSGLINCVMFPR
jgi:hypothetical protein